MPFGDLSLVEYRCCSLSNMDHESLKVPGLRERRVHVRYYT